ncbi:tetratricopeptide repeat protein [Streptomyces sp. NPDC003247]|uniref:tetratricopeptide repeat protein n=1 Tax=Streptomyces sp. NPDC003247 TaxID=3364677 RepID=UPI00369D2BA5
MGGIGKTALAVEAAHRACGKGWFPGGTLFVDLRGYDDDPVTADQAVLALLDALGVRGPDLPTTPTGQYDTYRVLLAGRPGRMLLVLDNASDPEQFRELLPGTDHHRVLITSRDRPDALPVRLVDLETLEAEESVALLTRALHDADERDDRPEREPDALGELADLCGHLPLALQIAAAMLRRRRHRDVATLVAEIRAAGDATAVLDKGRPGTDLYGRSLVLRPVLETSYARLPDEQARLLRLLCLAPGAETGTEAVAALADLAVSDAVALLEHLAATHLITPSRAAVGGDAPVRWRVHDLVRAFGAGVVAADPESSREGVAARARVLEFYRRWADAADARLRWLPEGQSGLPFASRQEALAWLDTERAGLVAAVGWATETRFAPSAVWLADCLATYLNWRRYFDDWITVAGTAQKAAHRVGYRLQEAGAWNNLGNALWGLKRVEEAAEAHIRARDLFRLEGDLRHEGMAWNNLGGCLREAGRTEEAIEAHIRARDLFRAVDDRHHEGTAWNNLGIALEAVGRAEEAVEACRKDLEICQELGDRLGEGTSWHNLGNALRKAGRTADAIEAYGKSLEICYAFDDLYGAGQTLRTLAGAHEDARDLAEARQAYLRAADAFTRTDAPAEAAHVRSLATRPAGPS